MKRPDLRRIPSRVRTHGTRGAVGLKRAYDETSPGDGMRVLVDRLWPRGLSKAQLAIDLWLKDAAPSDALRRWYGHQPQRWESFATRYRAELEQRTDVLRLLDELRRRGRVTLLYGARDPTRNNAVVLRDVLEERAWLTKRTSKVITMPERPKPAIPIAIGPTARYRRLRSSNH